MHNISFESHAFVFFFFIKSIRMTEECIVKLFTAFITGFSYVSKMSRENLILQYAYNRGADQLAHPCSLISTFVVRYLDSIICILAKSKISRL